MSLYRALVTNNKDPLQNGRVQIMIPSFHHNIRVSDLPWASVCTPFPVAVDSGSLILPAQGDIVWVLSETGDVHNWVYLGFAYSTLYNEKHRIFETDVFSASNNKVTTTFVTQETPDNTIRTIYKSPKGASITIDERDNQETLAIIDRGGLAIQLKTPISIEDNKNNKTRRGNRTSSSIPEITEQELLIQGKDFEIVCSGKTTNDQYNTTIKIKSTNLELDITNPLINITTEGAQGVIDIRNLLQ